jgi:hypothetical protein
MLYLSEYQIVINYFVNILLSRTQVNNFISQKVSTYFRLRHNITNFIYVTLSITPLDSNNAKKGDRFL